MTDKISFIHAADLHLDSPFKGLSHLPENIFDDIRQSTFQSFQQLIELAITKQVDFIVLVGDLFDYERQSLKAQIRLRTAFQELEKHQIQVYLSYGNHDFTDGNIHVVEFPKNVHVFPDEGVISYTFHKSESVSVRISGFSYESRAVTEEKAIEFPSKCQEASFHIGMLHGSIDGDKEHDTYAPFRLQQLLDKQYDYWALGHIHKRQKLHDDPPVIYPGNIQSRHRNEQGEKGCYFVELVKDNKAQTTFQPLQTIRFLHFHINLHDNDKLEEIETTIWEELQDKQDGRYLISITWQSQSDYWMAEYTDGWLDDLIDSLNERLYVDHNWMYIFKHQMDLEQQEAPDYHPHFITEIEQAFSNMNITEELKELTSHKKGRRFMERPEESLKEEAKQLLYAALLETKRDE